MSELTPEIKKEIDNLTYAQMSEKQFKTPKEDVFWEGDTGGYFRMVLDKRLAEQVKELKPKGFKYDMHPM